MAEDGQLQRRATARRSLRGDAQLLLSNTETFDGRTLDISADGLGLVMPVNVPEKLACTVKFSIPSTAAHRLWFEAKAAVVHSVLSGREDGFKIGLQFRRPSSELASAIRAYVED